MLQRIVFAQKRYLEQYTAPCKALFHPPPSPRKYSAESPRTLDEPINKHTNSTDSLSKPPLPFKLAHPLAGLSPELIPLLDKPHPPSTNRVLRYINNKPSLSALFSDRAQIHALAENLARTGNPLYSSRIVHLAGTYGCSLKQSTYECVSFHLASSKQWDTVLQVVAIGRLHTGRSTSRLLNWRALALLETRQYGLLPHVLEEFLDAGLTPSRRSYHLVLSGHLRNHDLASAKECLQSMEAGQIPADATTHALIAKHYRPFGQDALVQKKSLEILPALSENAAVAVLNGMMRCAMDVDENHSILVFLSCFEANSIAPLLPIIGQETVQPVAIRKALLPNAATLALFVNYGTRKGKHLEAVNAIRSMPSMGINATPEIVAAFLHGLFSSGYRDAAIKLFIQLCEKNNLPQALFQPLLQDRRPDAAHDELPLDISNITLTIRICNVVLKWILDSPYAIRGAEAVFAVMHASNIHWNSVTVEVLLSYLKDARRSHPGILINAIRKLSNPPSTSLRQLHKVISSILQHEKHLLYGSGWNVVKSKFRTNLGRHVPNDRLSRVSPNFDPAAGVEGPKRPLKRPSLDSLIAPFTARNVQSDSAMMALRIRRDAVLQSDMESAQNVFRSLLARGIHPNAYHFCALMEGYALSGDLEMATEIMRSAEKAGVKSNTVMYTVLISGYARYHQPRKALQAFHKMVAQEIKPDIASIDAVVGAYYAVGAYNVAKRILKDLWTHIQPFPEHLRDADLRHLTSNLRALQNKSPKLTRLSKVERLSVHLAVKRIKKAYSRDTRPSQPCKCLPLT